MSKRPKVRPRLKETEMGQNLAGAGGRVVGRGDAWEASRGWVTKEPEVGFGSSRAWKKEEASDQAEALTQVTETAALPVTSVTTVSLVLSGFVQEK